MKRSTRSTSLSSPKTPKPRMYAVLGIVAMLISSSAWSAQEARAVGLAIPSSGDLDATFGVGGKVTTDFFGSTDIANALAIQPDGKSVAAGTTFNSITGFDFALARYNVDGSLDSSFGSGGKVNTDFFDAPIFDDVAFSVAIQSDGKIVAAGLAGDSLTRVVGFALARYNTDGCLDSTFGSGGRVKTDVGRGGGAFGVAIQPDGKIVAAGRAVDPDTFVIKFALVRYNTDGSLDSSFGSEGRVTTDFFGTLSEAFALAIQSDGKIVAAGDARDTFDDLALARYNTDGSLDLTFGVGGKVTTDVGGHNDEAFAVVLQPDGKIVVAGNAFHIGDTIDDFALVRYNTDGSLDFSFGSGGKVTTDFFGSTDAASALAIWPDGKLVAVGRAVKGGEGFNFGLARYNTDGTLDVSFGIGGKVTTDFFGIDDWPNAVAIQPDAKIVAAGSSSAFTDFALARYEAPLFNICLQDDSNRTLLQINSITGDYQFTNCSGFTLSGTGSLIKKGSIITLQHYAADRRVLARIDMSVNKGTASIQVFSQGTTFMITDRNTANTCACAVT